MLIINGRIITWDEPNQILEGQAIFISGDRIFELGPQAEMIRRFPDADDFGQEFADLPDCPACARFRRRACLQDEILPPS